MQEAGTVVNSNSVLDCGKQLAFNGSLFILLDNKLVSETLHVMGSHPDITVSKMHHLRRTWSPTSTFPLLEV